MVKVWAGKDWEEEFNGDRMIIFSKIKGRRGIHWHYADWPPVRLIILTEAEYEKLTTYDPNDR